MMPWMKVTGPRANQYRCHLFEQLVRDDDGKVLGMVMQFYDGHAYYPVGERGRYGPHSTLEAARAAVESGLTPEDYHRRRR